ncbi:MAG TPA: hypothetical protein VII59_16215 [Streptosporangiaceae bacterium]
MTNMWEGLGPDHRPTAPHRAAGPGDGGPWAGGGSAGGGPAGGGRSGGGRRRRWTAGLLIAAVAAGGGAFAVAEATGAPAASTPISLSASSASSANQDAATQVAALSAALRGRGGHGGLARLRRLGGMYGQFTAETKKGARTLAFERGTITSAAGGAVTVRAHDGTTWVWDLTGTSVVRDDGKAATSSALATGELVFVGGPVASGTRDARLIVIRKAASGAA